MEILRLSFRLQRLRLSLMIFSQGFASLGACIRCQTPQLLELDDVRLGVIEPRQDVKNQTVGIGQVRRNIAMQRARHDIAGSKVNAHQGHGAHRLPYRFKVTVDKVGNTVIREQHGSRKTGIRSREVFVELS